MDFSDDVYDEELNHNENAKTDRHRMEVRRAIEARLELQRLQKELDYLFDEDFPNEDSE